jgi:hypothetical protein
VSHVAHHPELVVALPTLASLEELADVLASLHAAVSAYEQARAEYEAMMRAAAREREARKVLARLQVILATRQAQL